MSKAEEMGLMVYPVIMMKSAYCDRGEPDVDVNARDRASYIAGYEQAFEDVKKEVIKNLDSLHRIEQLSDTKTEKAWNEGFKYGLKVTLDFIDDK